jgi:hypothetical protein
MVIAIVAVVVAVFFAARGRGGELSTERGDFAPLDLGPVSATDVILLRPPATLWGYNMRATDAAMEVIAESVRERDVRIVALEQLVTDLSRDHATPVPLASPYAGARHRRTPPGGTDTTEMSTAGMSAGWTQPATTEPAAPDPAEFDPATSDRAAFDRAAFDRPPFDRASFGPGSSDTRSSEAVWPGTEPSDAAWPDTEASDTGPSDPESPGASATESGTPATEPARRPFDPAFDPARPSGEVQGPPPEQSHD